MTEEEKEKIINAFNNAWNKKIASENSYGKLASKEMFENNQEIKTEISTDCSYYKDVVKEDLLERIEKLEQENKDLKKQIESDKGLITVGGKQQYQYLQKMDELEQENKELKEIINKSARSFCNDYLKTFEENKFLNKQIMEVKFNAQQEIEFLTEENNNYRSALEEIKEIVADEIDKTDSDDELMQIYGTIYNKINEVLTL